MLESVIKMGKNHYPQTVLEECKSEIKKNKMENFINESDNESDIEESNESDNEESNGSDNEECND